MNLQILYQWTEKLATHLPSLNSWQVTNVGLFSLGIVEAENCQQGPVARQVACGERVASAMRRFRRFLDNEQFPLRAFFVEWTKWVVARLPEPEVTVLVDETKLADRLGVMMVGVAWEGRCIPLAWRSYRVNQPGVYPAEGQVELIAGLLKQVQAGIGAQRGVRVMADRGIGTSPRLCRAVEALGWRYLFRVSSQSKLCTSQHDYTIAQMVQEGEYWSQSGRVFKRRGQLPAQARALWAPGQAEPWALVTNDPLLTGFEYAQRNWQEQSFRDLKSGGWQWHTSRIRHPDHMDRLLVLLAVAYGWLVALGSQAVALRTSTSGGLVATRRHWSLFKEGLHYFADRIRRQQWCPPLLFLPDQRFT